MDQRAGRLHALDAAVRGLRDRPALKLLVFEGEGKHFSFGAVVGAKGAVAFWRWAKIFGKILMGKKFTH